MIERNWRGTVHKLPTTPNIYTQSNYPAENIAPSEQGVTSQIFYVTDRSPHIHDGEIFNYDHDRSPSMVFGEAIVSYDEDLSWESPWT